MGAEPIAGHEIAGEEQVEPLAVETAMALRMTGQMDDAQAAPIRKFLIGREGLLDGRGAVAEKPPPDCLEESAEAARARVGESAVNVALLRRMGEDGRAGEFLEPREIAGVIEVAVSEENGLDVGPAEAEPAHDFLQPRNLAHQPGIEQHRLAPGAVMEEMERAVPAAHRVNAEEIVERNIV
jgi:hypothetical protein